MQESWTYLGAVDDRVRLFPYNYNIKSGHWPDPISTLIDYAVFGPPVIIHQSAMLVQPELILDLLKGEKSIIYNLAKHNRLRILSLNGQLVDWIYNAKKRGINTYQNRPMELMDSLEGLKHFEKLLLKSNQGFLGMPTKDCSSVMYDLLMTRFSGQYSNADNGLTLFDKNSPIINSVVKEFVKRFEKKQKEIGDAYVAPTRTHWQEAIEAVIPMRGKKDLSKRKLQIELMTLGNECYHLAHSACIAAEVEKPIAVNTVLSERFLNYYDLDTTTKSSDNLLGATRIPAGFQVPKLDIINNAEQFFEELYAPQSYLNTARRKFVERFDHNQSIQEQIHRVFSYSEEINKTLKLGSPRILKAEKEYEQCSHWLAPITTGLYAGLATTLAIRSFAEGGDKPIHKQTKNQERIIDLDKRKTLSLIAGFGMAVGTTATTIAKDFAKVQFFDAVCTESTIENAENRNTDIQNKIGTEALSLESNFILNKTNAIELTKLAFTHEANSEFPSCNSENLPT